MRPLLAALLGLALGGAAPAGTVVLASTTSVDNSGLLARILPAFTRATGIEVQVVALGTGQALALAGRGDADLVLVHDPDAEQAFMAAGHGMVRRTLAWNDFVVIGPAADPAHVAGLHDAAAAFRVIADCHAPFVSRGDRSGTDAQEKRLWRAAGLDPARLDAGWYREIGGGMGAALNTASAMGAYLLSDRGTWLAFGNRGDLRIVVEGGAALVNRYDVITLDPAEHRLEGRAPAQALADWLLSADGQGEIGDYKLGGEPLFHPGAPP